MHNTPLSLTSLNDSLKGVLYLSPRRMYLLEAWLFGMYYLISLFCKIQTNKKINRSRSNGLERGEYIEVTS